MFQKLRPLTLRSRGARTSVALTLFLTALLAPVPATANAGKEYLAMVESADLENHPERHKKLAEWCQYNFPSKKEFHARAYQLHLFEGMESHLPAEPTADHYSKLAEEAEKRGLDEKYREHKENWAEIVMAKHADRIPEGDLDMMKQLLDWTTAHDIAFTSPAKQLAEDIIALESDYRPARELLGQMRIGDRWVTDKEEYLASIDPRDPAARVELHRGLMKSGAGEENSRPSSPFRGFEEVGNQYLASTEAATARPNISSPPPTIAAPNRTRW